MSYENEEREEDGISIGDICRMIFSQKILALIVAVVLFVLCTVVLYFGYSASNVTYSVTFTLTLLNADSSSTYYSLPDGTVFYYSDYVSQEVLADVVENNSDSLGYINYTKMSQRNDISLTKTTSSDENSSVLTISSGDIFTITVKGSYFHSGDDATLFLTTLAQYPIASYISANANADYTSYLSYSDFSNALTFTEQINYINAQIDYISELYENISSSSVTSSLSSTVAATVSNFNAWVSRLDIDSLSAEIETYYYCKDYESTLEKYENQLVKSNGLYAQYEDAKTYYELLVNSLSNITSTSSLVTETLSEAYTQVTSLKQQINLYQNYISAYYETTTDPDTGFLVRDAEGRIVLGELKSAHVTETATFAQEIDDIFLELTENNEYIAKYVELNESVCKDVCSVNYADSSKAVSDEPLSLLLTVVISLVISIFATCIISYVVAATKKSKAKNEAKKRKEEKAVADKE